jgi:hypothetical protein
MEVSAYNIIRTYAPNTPVLLFSYAVFGGTDGANAAMQDIHAFNQAVFGNQNAVWTNEAVAFHGEAPGRTTIFLAPHEGALAGGGTIPIVHLTKGQFE